jgi:hypothetical protein
MADRTIVRRVTTIRTLVRNVGPPGTPGQDGVDGQDGAAGLSAYEVAVTDGFLGTEQDWLDSLVGNDGAPGAAGVDGDDGSVWRDGAGAPSNGLGVDGDYYLRTSNGDVYAKAAGVYTVVGNIKGATGLQGVQGDPGTDGADGNDGSPGAPGSAGAPGSVWRSGAGAPSNGTGIDGDFYLRTSNGDVYTRAAGTYSVTGNILGPTGIDGADGDDGAAGLSAYEVAVSEGFIGNEAAWLASLVGDDGAPGADGSDGSDGAPGSVWRDGSGAPSNGTGIDGDYYLRTSNGDVYLRSGGTYSVVGNIKGATGTTGSTGSAGATWRTGSGLPSNGTGADGDLYLDASTGNYYLRTSGAYVLSGNLKGPTGDQGATGATGATGQSGVSAGTYLVQGATIAYVSGLTFRIGAATYYVDGVLVTSAEQNVTLDASDPTNPRLDVLVLDASGIADSITGTAAASPAEPSVDPSVYLKLGIVNVAAGVTTIAVTETSIWKEDTGTDWTAVPSGGSIVIASTSNPRTGTKDIEGTAVAAGANVVFTIDSGSLDLATQDKLVFYVRVKAAWPTKKALALTWLAGAVTKGATVTVGNGLYGLNSQSAGAYQQIVVPMSAFSVPAGSAITKLRLEVTGAGASIGFYLDDIITQAGITQGTVSQFRWRGAWASTTAYDQNDAVIRSNVTYLALQPSLNQDPASAAAFWADQGATKAYVDAAGGGGSDDAAWSRVFMGGF